MILKLNASKKKKENEQNYSKNLKNKDLAAMLLKFASGAQQGFRDIKLINICALELFRGTVYVKFMSLSFAGTSFYRKK